MTCEAGGAYAPPASQTPGCCGATVNEQVSSRLSGDTWFCADAFVETLADACADACADAANACADTCADACANACAGACADAISFISQFH